MLSWERRASLAETALQRSEAGRTRLRSALAEQRTEADERIVEQERQLLAAQRQLRELEAEGGGAMTEKQLDALRYHVTQLLDQKLAAEKELEAQQAVLSSAHTFHVQQQRFHDRLQSELASLHNKERQQEEQQHTLQSRLQELQQKLAEAPTVRNSTSAAAAGAPPSSPGAPGVPPRPSLRV